MWCSARFGSHYSSSLVWKTLVVTNSHEGDKEVKVANERTLMLKTSCSDRLTAIRERGRSRKRERRGEGGRVRMRKVEEICTYLSKLWVACYC